MSIATRYTGRVTNEFKRLLCEPNIHALLKQEAAEADTSLTEIAYLTLCRGMERDPKTLKPLTSTGHQSVTH